VHWHILEKAIVWTIALLAEFAWQSLLSVMKARPPNLHLLSASGFPSLHVPPPLLWTWSCMSAPSPPPPSLAVAARADEGRLASYDVSSRCSSSPSSEPPALPSPAPPPASSRVTRFFRVLRESPSRLPEEVTAAPAVGAGLGPGFLTSRKAAHVRRLLLAEGSCVDEAEASSESGAAEVDGAAEAPAVVSSAGWDVGGPWGKIGPWAPMGTWTRRCCGQERVYGMGTRASNTKMSA